MEDTLRVNNFSVTGYICSLNPCFNGRYSQSQFTPSTYTPVGVLILVLMEDTLRVPGLIDKVKAFAVLILVLMEDTLRALLF